MSSSRLSGRLAIIMVALNTLIAITGFAQQSTPPSNAPPLQITTTANLQEPQTKGIAASGVSWLTQDEFRLSIVVLVFGTLVLVMEYALLRGKRIKSDEILRICAITVILVGTLFIVTAGFNINDVAPAIGLFGTVAGYLMGTRRTSKQGADDEE